MANLRKHTRIQTWPCVRGRAVGAPAGVSGTWGCGAPGWAVEEAAVVAFVPLDASRPSWLSAGYVGLCSEHAAEVRRWERSA